MLVIEIYVPLKDNDGKGFDEGSFVEFEKTLAERFGGFSRLPGTIRGGWMDEGRFYRDDLTVYAVALPSIVKAGELGETVKVAKVLFRQEAIFVRYLGQAETL